MKLLDGLNYYEILEVTPEYSFSAIRQAYQSLLALYQDDPVVTDSFFTDKEKSLIIEKIEEAFGVLSDPQQKAEYDRVNSMQKDCQASSLDSCPCPESRAGEVTPLFSIKKEAPDTVSIENIPALAKQQEFTKLSENILAQEKISGQDIKLLRQALEISVEKVFEITRIGSGTIGMIENDQFADLPPRVYLRGFLADYAEVLQLPSETVVKGYLKYMEEN